MNNYVAKVNKNSFNENQERLFYYETDGIAISISRNMDQDYLIHKSDKKTDWYKAVIVKAVLTNEPENIQGNASTKAQLYHYATQLGLKISVKKVSPDLLCVMNGDKVSVVNEVMNQITVDCHIDVSHLTQSQRNNIYSRCRSAGLNIQIRNNTLTCHPATAVKVTDAPTARLTPSLHDWIDVHVKPVHNTTYEIPSEITSLARSTQSLRSAVYSHPYLLKLDTQSFTVTYYRYLLTNVRGGVIVNRHSVTHGTELVFCQNGVSITSLKSVKPCPFKSEFIVKCKKNDIPLEIIVDSN